MWCWQHCQWHHCISLVKTIKMRCNMTFWLFDAIGTGISVPSCHQHHQLYYCIPQLNTTEISATWLFWSCNAIVGSISVMCCNRNEVQHHFLPINTIGTNVGGTWCQQCCQWHHWIPQIKTIQMSCNMMFLIMQTTGASILIMSC